MKVAYVDTSCLVALAFAESVAPAMRRRLAAFDELVSSSLLEAELRAACQRERVKYDPRIAAGLSWVLPDIPLSEQIERVLGAGYLRGADLWHLACALYLVDAPDQLTFLTLDERQRGVAEALNFAV